METKLFEIRDSMTFIPVMCVRPVPRDDAEDYLLRSAGYSEEKYLVCREVLMIQITGGSGHASCDPYDFGSSRTFMVALQHITKNWRHLSTGDVVDVQFIIGETKAPKQAQRLDESRL
jgi:hypothetical protein